MLTNVSLHQIGFLVRLPLASIQRYEVTVFILFMHVVLHTLENKLRITFVLRSERFTKTDTYSWNVHVNRQQQNV